MLEFVRRLQLLQSKIADKISHQTNLSPAEKIIKINHYNEIAFETFILNCTGMVDYDLHFRKPNSLEDAMSNVSDFENFELAKTLNNKFTIKPQIPQQK